MKKERARQCRRALHLWRPRGRRRHQSPMAHL